MSQVSNTHPECRCTADLLTNWLLSDTSTEESFMSNSSCVISSGYSLQLQYQCAAESKSNGAIEILYAHVVNVAHKLQCYIGAFLTKVDQGNQNKV
jgi:hypothetical protein